MVEWATLRESFRVLGLVSVLLTESLWLMSFTKLREVPFVPSLHYNRYPRGVFSPLAFIMDCGGSHYVEPPLHS